MHPSTYLQRVIALGLSIATLLLSGCVGVTQLQANASQAEVLQAWGKPTSVKTMPSGERWLYSMAPEGRQAWLLDFNAQGQLVSNVQVLTPEQIAKLAIGQTREEVEALIGPDYYSLRYPFKREELVRIYRFMNVVTPTCLYVGYMGPEGQERVSSIGFRDEVRRETYLETPMRPC